MLSENIVKDLIDNALEERSDLFLIDLKMGADNKISVVIDGDNGVTVEDCIFMSRAIEHSLDRENEDFSLDVASAGATSPLINMRQYRKNVGRTLEVKAKSNSKFEGKLIDVDDAGITLEWKTKEPKPVGKGKVVVIKQAKITYDDILEAKVVIKF
ncbi:ribosome assembly cofactor RimP [uncultured Gelidibacter sp.]|uniref:ribosome assembly cofactor RimP n=1 Tax=uncultured Gelidibacter sp. TaxID=259318 RepID=UPI00262CFA69|nr:ribosome assembly cofactor RimP [uncultured Gelidibacter sp.]